MDDNKQKETNQGYEIIRAVTFENGRGFAVGYNPKAPDPYVTWAFTDKDGKRDYEWGHYKGSYITSSMDYKNRINVYFDSHRVPEKDAYRYYSTQRPVDIGTYPKTDGGPVRFENFDEREDVEQGQFKAWGYLVYDAPLTEKQIADFELRAAPGNSDISGDTRQRTPAAPKPIMEQLADAQKQVERGGDPAAGKKKNIEER